MTTRPGVSLDTVTAFSTSNDTIPTKLRESTLSQRGAARAAPCSIVAVGNGHARRKVISICPSGSVKRSKVPTTASSNSTTVTTSTPCAASTGGDEARR